MKLERELQDIRKTALMSTPPSDSQMVFPKSIFQENPPDGSEQTHLFSLRDVSPNSRFSRTPGSVVSQLISKFESSSQSTSPACSEPHERFESVDYNSNFSKTLDTTRSAKSSLSSYTGSDNERNSPNAESYRSAIGSEGSRTSPWSSASSFSFKNISPHIIKKIEEIQGHRRQPSLESDFSVKNSQQIPAINSNKSEKSSPGDRLVSAKDIKGKVSPASQVYDSDIQDDQSTPVSTKSLCQDSATIVCSDKKYDYNTKCHSENREKSEGVVLQFGLDIDDELLQEKKTEQRDTLAQESVQEEKLSQGKENVSVELEVQTEFCMETSHLMKLMNEVAEQRVLISDLKAQVTYCLDCLRNVVHCILMRSTK